MATTAKLSFQCVPVGCYPALCLIAITSHTLDQIGIFLPVASLAQCEAATPHRIAKLIGNRISQPGIAF